MSSIEASRTIFAQTAVRNLERAGVPRSVAMKLTGHLTEAVYRRYAIVVQSDLREGVAKLSRLHENTHHDGHGGGAGTVVSIRKGLTSSIQVSARIGSYKVISPYKTTCEGGGTGRRSGLRIQCRKA